MNENIITIYDNKNNKKQYKVLLIIEKEYYYIIYTDLENNNIKKDLYAIKVSSMDELNPIPIDKDEWEMIQKEYSNLIKEKTL